VSFFRRVLNRFHPKRVEERQGVLVPAWPSKIGEKPTVSFATLVEIYVSDPAARAAVDFLADQAVGMGFYTTAEDEKAKKIVDDFSSLVNLDGLLQKTAREVVAYGNCFWEKIEPEKLESLKLLPITSIDNINRDQYGEVQGFKQTFRYGGTELQPNRIIHFCWNPVDGEAFGIGILRSIAETMVTGENETRPSFVTMKSEIEDSMTKIMKKYAGPTEIWKFPGANDEKAQGYAGQVKSIPREGARFVTNAKDVEVQTVAVDPRSRFDAYIEHIWNQFILGLQTPLPKLFTTPGFTEASARAAIEVAERKVLALQRFIKRIVEHEVFEPILKQAGLDSTKANCRLNWGMPEKPDINALLPILSNIARDRPDVILAHEFRAILKDLGLPLEETEQPVIAPESSQQA